MIRILAKHVADKIAAGEVVERPLSVIKELVENSIDSGATSITVEIKNGGKTYMRVTDNGSGIHPDEVLLAFTRHATSKIETDKDLEAIETLGFRGEALASIAAVSHVELLTKQAENKLGKRVCISGGITLENTETGCPDGTTIIVTDLFFNTPARLKFMKSDRAESSAVIDFLSQVSLAYPDIRIRVINNGSVLFATNGKGDVKANILTVYSREIADDLVPVSYDREYISVKGYVSTPGISRTNRKKQIFFVNGRVVNSRVIEKGVSDAYSDRLFEGRFPIAFLFISISPEKLDVNIHPNKKEVKFDDNMLVCSAVNEAIKEALMHKEAIPQVRERNIFKMKSEPKAEEKTVVKPEIKKEITTPAKAASENIKVVKPQVDIKELLSNMREEENKQRKIEEEKIQEVKRAEIKVEPKSEKVQEKIDFSYNATTQVKTSDSVSENPAIPTVVPAPVKVSRPFDFTELTIKGSIFGTYILLTDDETFYMIDQHAAHERIFFEKLLSEYQNSEKMQQSLMIPIVLNLPYGAKAAADDNIKQLTDMGFDVEEFGPKAYVVKAVPMFMEMAEAEDFLNYFVENVSDENVIVDRAKLEKIMSAACKSAIKAGDLLKNEEIEELITELAKCDNPYSCPHGRPTFIKMTKYEIEKMFKRV